MESKTASQWELLTKLDKPEELVFIQPTTSTASTAPAKSGDDVGTESSLVDKNDGDCLSPKSSAFKIAIAGGSGQVAQEIIDALIKEDKHEITILTRSNSTTTTDRPEVTTRAVDYMDNSDLTAALQGIHTVLSFIQLLSDPGNTLQKNLIDAAITAGVKRFAPSEWASADMKDMPWWSGKAEIREYLRKINENEKRIEYTLFQPGLFLNYLAFPHLTSAHITPLNTRFDFRHRRAITIAQHNYHITLTTSADLAAIVAAAVSLPENSWPIDGGIRGNRVTVSEIIAVGEKIRGGAPFNIDTVKLEDLERGVLDASWKLETKHASVSEEQAGEMMKSVMVGMLVSGAKGGWDVSDGFNASFPDYEFTKLEEFLGAVWEGKD
ncbi:NAD(P)-binding protein [Tothia fuscella]|uniref:NAD(P)-binding protein n=1 Tax=Tothia fuscella TaxID=1048955 RepID=A0A9P4P290_9PEZI|nr:NAD(P)-binding protein [Tothia fuscella]